MAARLVQPLTATSFRRASVFPNGSIENAYLSYRDLRTRQVIEKGWFLADELPGGQDGDGYDAFDAPTRSIVVTDEQNEAVGGARITLHDGPIESSISMQMWAEKAPQIDLREHPEFVRAYEERQLLDMTRLLCESGMESPANVLGIIGAGVTATGASMGSYFTSGSQMARLLRLAGIETHELTHGLLGRDRCALLWVPPRAWAEVGRARTRRLLTRGALAFDEQVALDMPFFELPHNESEPSLRRAVKRTQAPLFSNARAV